MNATALPLPKLLRATALRRDLALLAAVTIVTLAAELALVERKYAIFGGGFGQSQALTGPGPIAAFLIVLLACHALVVALAFLAVRALHRWLKRPHLFSINFLVLAPGFAVAALIAKFEVLSYFSDAISFQLIRKLGGGSLFDAALFVLSDGALMIAGAVAAIGAWMLALRRWAPRGGADGGGKGRGFAPRPRALACAALAVAGALFLAGGQAEVRTALGRFNAVWLARTILSQASDFDRDGWSFYTHPIDARPFDGSRHPYALDVPGNGIDEDGLGGDFVPAGLLAAADSAPATLPDKRRHLIVIVLESTRGDALGRTIGGRSVTPHIDAIAAQGSAFPAAYSHVGFTTDSLKSLFSGQHEPRPGGPSLFRDLKANGYRIGVLSGQPESFGGIAETLGMRETADIYADAETLEAERAFGFAAKGSLLVDGAVLLREFDRALGRAEAWDRPVFLYVNFQSPHFPYHHPGMVQHLPGRPIPRSAISAKNKAWVAATYWNAVAAADAQVGALVARLKALGVYDEALVVVTADHGESLFDDGFLGHGHMLNRQQTHIPLVVNVPGVATPRPIGLTDYRALILSLLGAEGSGDMSGDTSGGAVLQYIGTLDRPAHIGMVEEGGRWTVLKLDDRSLRFSDIPGVHDVDALDGALGARAARLIRMWEEARWTAHLSRTR